MPIDNGHNDIAEEAMHPGTNATVFQAEVFVVERAASHLIFTETKNKNIFMNCDSYKLQFWLLTTPKLSPKKSLTQYWRLTHWERTTRYSTHEMDPSTLFG